VGWAIGSGVNVPYIPTPRAGVTFNSSHTHYLFQAGITSANAQTLLENMVKELRHHGHSGNLIAFVSESDVDIYAGMSKFVALQPNGFMIVPGNGAASVQVAQGTNSGLPGELAIEMAHVAHDCKNNRWQGALCHRMIRLTRTFLQLRSPKCSDIGWNR